MGEREYQREQAAERKRERNMREKESKKSMDNKQQAGNQFVVMAHTALLDFSVLLACMRACMHAVLHSKLLSV